MFTLDPVTELTSELQQRLTIAKLLGTWARETPKNIAIVAPGRSPLTYSRLTAQIEESVRTLNAMGLGRNDRIAIVLPNGPEMAVAFLVAGSAATCAPLNPAYRASEFDFYLDDLKAKAVIVQLGVESPARTVAQKRGIPIIELEPCAAAAAGLFTLTGNSSSPAKHSGFAEPEDVALVLHTSGTTARPKIVPLSHKNLCASARHIRDTLELAPDDRCLNVMPLFHIHGLIGAALSSLAGGASVVCTPGFYAPKFFEWMDEFKPSWYTAVPTMHQAILSRADTNREIIGRSPLRLIRSSSAALPPQVMAELEGVFKAPVIESYGMTEASHQMASNPLPPRVRKPGSVGVAAGPEIAIMGDVGELLPAQRNGEVVIRGPNVIAGYENNAVANASAFTTGWFRTGDQGYLDTDGYLFINGRLKEIINRGGEKISPREIDEVLLNHPAVAQAAAFAIPHTKLGEEIGAAVVLRENSSATERDLREFAAARLADFKVPYRILILDEIPKGPTGKLQRIGLAEKLGLQPINPQLPEQRREFTRPRDDCESALANIWSEVLGQSQVSVHDNFLELGGDSILGAQILSRVRRTLRVEIPLLVLFEEGSNIADLAKAIQRVRHYGETSPAFGIVPGKGGRDLPLSFGQERLWFLSQFEPGNPAYNRPAALRLAGLLEISTLERSLSEIIRRHEVLRSTVSAVDGQPVQILSPAMPVRLSAVDLRRVPAGQRETELRCLTVAEAQSPFDLEKGPLLRLKLYRVADEEHVLLLTAHHSVFDGWSMEVFTRELTALYEAFSAGKPAPLAEPPIQYADFARWQRQWMQPERLNQHLAYWKEQLHDALAELPFPTDRPRLSVPTYRGGREKVSLSKSLTESIQNVSQEEGVTLFMTLLAAWQTLLFRYTQQSDISIGTAIACRNQKETEGLIGFFVNLLVLRSDLSGDPTFRSLLKRVRAMALGAYAHQDLPFEKLVEALQPKRNFNRTPLFQVMFVLKRATPATICFSGLTLTPQETEDSMAVFDLALELWEGPDGLHGYLEYSADLFDATTIQRLVGHYRNLLEGIVAAPDARLSHLPLLSQAEQGQLLVEWNDTRADYANNSCLHELIEAQAQRSPDAIAVTFEGRALTYQALDRRANQVAHHLQKLGVGPDSLVGLCVERSLEMVIGLLGILKAGGAYVPLDPSYPKERLELMLADSRVVVLLTQTGLTAGLPDPGGSRICLDSDWDRISRESEEKPVSTVAAENLAYVIYTSGSTGRPKGVLIQHRSIVNIIASFIGNYRPEGRDKMLQQTSISFDVSVVEICAILAAGGTLVLPSRSEVFDLDEFISFMVRTEVTMLSAAPSLLARLNSTENALPKLRLLMSGGEALALSDIDNLLRSRTVINGYGPTEAAVCTSCYNLSANPPRSGISIPIGKPLANYEVYVLGENLDCMAIGCPGELYIGGAGLARGYLNDPELTSLRFLPNPFRPGERMYRTGDRVRWLADGNLDFVGRLDRQVKIRGFRIELGEIEAVLGQHPGVQEATVVAQQYGAKETRLVGYLVPDRKRAFPVCQLVRLEREGSLRGLPKYELPNGMVIVHQNKGETDFIYREIFEQQVLLRHGITLNDGDCIFDVGANIGLFTLFVGQRCKRPVIYAFEPIPPIFEKLSINAALYGLNVKLFECGLASRSRQETFTYFPQVSAMSGHFTEGSDMETREKEVTAALGDYIGRIASADGFEVPRQAVAEELSAKNVKIERFTCQLKTLSEVIRENKVERIDLLKIDVEKSELDVLAGIHEDDWAKLRQIVVEVHDPEGPLEQITALLRRRGYNVGVHQEALFKDTHILTTNVYGVRPFRDRVISPGPAVKPPAELSPTWTSPDQLVSDVQLYLNEKLPAYMVPSALILLDTMPLTPNGKVDLAVLPKPAQVLTELDKNYVAPRNAVETAIAEIWKEVLGIKRVGIHHSFFELGGHSLLAMQIVSRVGEAFQVELPLRALFEASTVAELALMLSQYQSENVS